MDENVFEGKWKELRGRVQERWGELTDNELDQIEGKSEKMIGLLQAKYGYASDKAEQEFNEFLKEL